MEKTERHLHRFEISKGRAITAISLLMLFVTLSTVLGATGALFTSMPGNKLLSSGDVTVDYSNASRGYVCVKHTETEKKLKVKIACGNESDTHDLSQNGEYNVFPLTHGSGTYTITVYINVSGTKYAQKFAKSISVEMDDSMSCWLYPNQYVWYTEDSSAVKAASELCEGLSDDMDKIKTLYAYVKNNIVFDYTKAFTVKSTYLPNADETLKAGSGICFDYASLLACMLRSQGIPTQLVEGYLTSGYFHAWNKVYVNGEWRMLDATFAGKYSSKDYRAENAY